MFAIPLNDHSAFAVRFEGNAAEDQNEEDVPLDEPAQPSIWWHHFIDFDPLNVLSFRTPGVGYVYSATLNSKTGAVWMLARNKVYILSREKHQVFEAVLPQKGLAIFHVTEIQSRFYFSCSFGKVWCYDGPVGEWNPVLTSEPPPARKPRLEGETAATYVARTTPARIEYINSFPNFFASFALGGEIYFVGALGRIMRQSQDRFDRIDIDSGVRLVIGFAEGDEAVVCGNAPTAEIYKGTIDRGFEQIFASDDQSLHMTAFHNGVRYIGASVYPGREGPSLFIWDSKTLTPVSTGCAREPGNLIQLVSTGSVLWAVDHSGFFRLTKSGWSLTEISTVAPQD